MSRGQAIRYRFQGLTAGLAIAFGIFCFVAACGVFDDPKDADPSASAAVGAMSLIYVVGGVFIFFVKPEEKDRDDA